MNMIVPLGTPVRRRYGGAFCRREAALSNEAGSERTGTADRLRCRGAGNAQTAAPVGMGLGCMANAGSGFAEKPHPEAERLVEGCGVVPNPNLPADVFIAGSSFGPKEQRSVFVLCNRTAMHSFASCACTFRADFVARCTLRNRTAMHSFASCACTFRADFVARCTLRNRTAMHGIASCACTFRADFVARCTSCNRTAMHGIASCACTFRADFVAR